ncbi:hypothetical protein ES703_108698 [subsurface metagenome]
MGNSLIKAETYHYFIAILKIFSLDLVDLQQISPKLSLNLIRELIQRIVKGNLQSLSHLEIGRKRSYPLYSFAQDGKIKCLNHLINF